MEVVFGRRVMRRRWCGIEHLPLLDSSRVTKASARLSIAAEGSYVLKIGND